MFKIQTFLFALLLSQTSASSLRPGATANQHHRDLSFEYFLSYEPLTNVNDHVSSDQ
jgi:hypothetical protein